MHLVWDSIGFFVIIISVGAVLLGVSWFLEGLQDKIRVQQEKACSFWDGYVYTAAQTVLSIIYIPVAIGVMLMCSVVAIFLSFLDGIQYTYCVDNASYRRNNKTKVKLN